MILENEMFTRTEEEKMKALNVVLDLMKWSDKVCKKAEVLKIDLNVFNDLLSLKTCALEHKYGVKNKYMTDEEYYSKLRKYEIILKDFDISLEVK